MLRYLYEYWDPNGSCKFIDISIYKITENHSIAVSQAKNRLKVVGFGHLSLENFSFYISPHFPAMIKNRQNYNHFHNILRLFDVLPSFLFTASETMGDYY